MPQRRLSSALTLHASGLTLPSSLCAKGQDILELRRHRGADTMEVAGHVIDAIEEFKPALVCIDEGGLGAGVVDQLKSSVQDTRRELWQ